MGEHVLKRFDEELNKLRFRLIKMGNLVNQQIEYAVKAMSDENPGYKDVIFENERKIDKLDIKIEKQCMRILALHQPMAMDLRFVLSAVSINNNYEMIGDLATNIAESLNKLNIAPGLMARTGLDRMGKTIQSQLSLLTNAYINRDIPAALEASDLDEEIDQLYHETYLVLIKEMKSDPEMIEGCSKLQEISHNFQVISRQINNIASELVFLFEARIIRHQKDLNDEEQGPDQ